jgi:methylated-DNA-[protein]-cysteine S-methyltransferase
MTMTDFAQKVYEITKQIPRGKVATYGQIATLAGSPGAARAVGMCMKHNLYAPVVPCHRVVGANGQLTGFSAKGGIAKKKSMLMTEGVTFIGNRVDMKRCGVKKE